MNKIEYTITFLGDWHIGSGLSGGAETDADVLKDHNSMPYIPGKTIKGLLKYALFELKHDAGQSGIETKKSFGDQGNFEGAAYFSNAEIDEDEYEEIVNHSLQTYLYRHMTSTRIDDQGVADDKTLRVIETCMPITLHGFVSNYENVDQLAMAMKLTRNIGMNRNRGLGRCIWQIKK